MGCLKLRHQAIANSIDQLLWGNMAETILEAGQVDFFKTFGYMVLPGLLREDDLATLGRELAEGLAAQSIGREESPHRHLADAGASAGDEL